MPKIRCPPIFCKRWTPIGAPPTTCRSARSICRTIRCSRAAEAEHIKPRLLGHWGTTPGLNFIYVHLNRLIEQNDLDMIYIAGPGHGGPGLVAQTYLEGPTPRRYPEIDRSRNGMQRLFRQFSWPYGIPSHVAPETPGSIHEGGELGYSLVHAYGAAFDNPDLIVACVIGDGEAETGPLARAGTPTNSSIRRATARCCRSCISTASRSPIRQCWRASAAEELTQLLARLRLRAAFRRRRRSR